MSLVLSDGAVSVTNADPQRILDERKALKKDGHKLMFTRRGDPIVSMHKAFRAACKEAGVGDRILHDLRRSAIRRMVRMGISETVAMRLSGHKTTSVFRRYDTSTDDLCDAALNLTSPPFDLDRKVKPRNSQRLCSRSENPENDN